MSINKRKKSSRMHGKKTHGYGSKKKHRGHGNRGGSGMGGSGKRADSKKPSSQRMKDYFGKHGFKVKGQYPNINTINIIDLEERLPALLSEGTVKQEKGGYTVDLAAIGYQKLLGSGIPTKKWNITVEYASAHALEKIKKAGGTVSVANPAETGTGE